MTTATTERCAACLRDFPTLAEVFSHPCDAIQPRSAPHATRPADNVDAPDQRPTTGRSTPKPAPSNRYPGRCVRCGHRVDAEAGLLVKDNSATRGSAWGVEHRFGQCPTTAPAPVAPPPAAGGHRSNRYPGQCTVCGQTVAAETGALTKNAAGKWSTRHLPGQCPTPTAPAAADYEPAKGDVHVIDDTYYRVHRSQGTGRFYAVRWTGTDWDYAKGAIVRLTTETVATADQAARFGVLYHRCVFCTAPLDTPESTTVGYGPVCAARRGLPWG